MTLEQATPLNLLTREKVSVPLRLDPSPIREQMEQLVKRAHELKSQICDDHEADRLFDEIGTLPGVSIIERRPYFRDADYRCAQYVFREILREPGASVKFESLPFWDRAIEFMRGKGFSVVDDPKHDDVIAYRYPGGDLREMTIKHWGIVRGVHIHSKFDQGHIFQHPLASVPSSYGGEAIFFRRMLGP